MKYMDEYISRKAAIEDLPAEALERNLDSVMTDDAHRYHRAAERVISGVHAADVVSRDCFDRILAQNDDMREMLAQNGKKPGDSMDDVRPVKRGKWTLNKDGSGTCSKCGFVQNSCWDFDNWDNFCHHCGADMREES